MEQEDCEGKGRVCETDEKERDVCANENGACLEERKKVNEGMAMSSLRCPGSVAGGMQRKWKNV